MAHKQTSTSSSKREAVLWDERFQERNVGKYKTEDKRILDGVDLSQITDELLIKKLFEDLSIDPLEPPHFNAQALRHFIGSASIRDFIQPSPTTDVPKKLAVVDDRRDEKGDHVTHRNLGSKMYSNQPHKGENDRIEDLDEHGLFKRLKEKRLPLKAERRLIHIHNPTAKCILALVANVPNRQAQSLRQFFNQYLLSKTAFKITMDNLQYVMEFQLPFFALRPSPMRNDDRCDGRRDGRSDRRQLPSKSLRTRRKMLSAISKVFPAQHLKDTFFYEAQTSFLIVGVDEWFWTAYCCTDTFFDDDKTMKWYIDEDTDGPSGSLRSSQPKWDPREYFLCVLSSRMRQVTLEWRNLIEELDYSLEIDENEYHDRIENENFFKEYFQHIRHYTRAVSILRRFHDMLERVSHAWYDFSDTQLAILENNIPAVDTRWAEHRSNIQESIAELRGYQRSLAQRIQSFDRMRDGLVNASALRESSIATTQGNNIALLTIMTVAYLPPSLATSAMGMSMVGSKSYNWAVFIGLLLSLIVATLSISGQHLKKMWATAMPRSSKHEDEFGNPTSPLLKIDGT